ncbi:lytic murein transglycosylase B [Xanthomonas albilineans]|uniref:lytic murein transglycosylase B n=1 Tax=Xanthomonas albilineans TaxID=29447 RepID=UPI0005F30771|nr:lytic murein transglycosylase B [Xanthomonas albilineans]PPU93333.1 lytic murein transglycosylase B [Xanthomonas albilineans]
MIRYVLMCLLALGLVACATLPKALPSSQASGSPSASRSTRPVETLPETVSAPPVDLTPVPFETARANFVRDTATKYGLDPAQIEAALAKAQFKDAIVEAMSRPAERVKPWSEYRPMFITPAQIDNGRAFVAAHRDALMRVQARTGVSAEIIVAIIGVETSYGKNMGKYRVLDALYTLAFRYPRSGDPANLEREVRRELYFRDELGQLFALVHEEHVDITTLMGSYAGAMGLGQFMPSSYRQYAVDGDGDGKRNMFTDYNDAFASIANYFVKRGGWVRGGLVAVPATLRAGAEEFNPSDWKPIYTMTDLAARGYTPNVPVPAGATATPITLDGSTGKQYWFGFQNYYAITRYNASKMYAMAVYQLSQAIAGKELPPA